MQTTTENTIEHQRLDLERERLKFERQGVVLRYVAILGAVATFFWGAFQYFHGIDLERAKQRKEQEAATAVQKITASKPFLERQLKLFEETTQTAAFIATMPDSPERPKKLERFEQLYWGELALVEHGPVEAAMVEFRAGLKANATDEELQRLSLGIARACRDELAKSWNVSHWLRNE
jgi:hypothetical protein